VAFYDLHVRINPADSTISGRNGITYRVTGPAREMQIDLQTPLQVDSMLQDGRRLAYRRDGNAFFVTLAAPQPVGSLKTVTVHYHGRPRVALRRRGTAASCGRATAWATRGSPPRCRGWAPACGGRTRTPGDEPDSQRVAVTVPDPMVDVSNGRLRSTTKNGDGTTTYEWFVSSPINNYDVAVNAGRYAHFSETYRGEGEG
jgi:aminopeptidase N